MISAHPVTLVGALVSLVGAISFLVIGIILLVFPRRIQKGDMGTYENLPAFLKFFRSPDYIRSRRFISGNTCLGSCINDSRVRHGSTYRPVAFRSQDLVQECEPDKIRIGG